MISALHYYKEDIYHSDQKAFELQTWFEPSACPSWQGSSSLGSEAWCVWTAQYETWWSHRSPSFCPENRKFYMYVQHQKEIDRLHDKKLSNLWNRPFLFTKMQNSAHVTQCGEVWSPLVISLSPPPLPNRLNILAGTSQSGTNQWPPPTPTPTPKIQYAPL